jgi:hypothetical protein
VQGQRSIKASRVLVVGAGGLDAPILTYLAAVGVGVIGLVDDDWVELSKLQRQVLFGTADVGSWKVEAASRDLTRSMISTDRAAARCARGATCGPGHGGLWVILSARILPPVCLLDSLFLRR